MRPQEAAESAVEGVRALGDVQVCGDYQRPSDVYAVVVELCLLARALPKALGQAAAWLEIEHDAARHTKPLVRSLDVAVEHAGHLTGNSS